MRNTTRNGNPTSTAGRTGGDGWPRPGDAIATQAKIEAALVQSLDTYLARTSSIVESANSYLAEVAGVLGRLPVDKLGQIVFRLEDARWKSQTVFTCGNGGSAATSIHFASDLAKGALAPNKPPVRARSLCENIALVTAWGNDASFDDIFTQPVSSWVRSGDVLVAISGSGNSQNVLNAVELAQSMGATTIGFTGFDGGRLKDCSDMCVTVPCHCMEQIEDVHLLLCHLITRCMREAPAEDVAEV